MSSTKVEVTPEVRKLRAQMARSLWDVDMKDTEFSDRKARNAKYAEDRGAYRKRAANLLRRLAKRGVTKIPAPTKDAAIEGADTEE
jgi:hypothetical protein